MNVQISALDIKGKLVVISSEKDFVTMDLYARLNKLLVDKGGATGVILLPSDGKLKVIDGEAVVDMSFEDFQKWVKNESS